MKNAVMELHDVEKLEITGLTQLSMDTFCRTIIIRFGDKDELTINLYTQDNQRKLAIEI